MANFRATAAGGKWSEITAWEEETAPTVWAPAAKAPGETDDVVFEASAGSITVAAEAKCRSLDATNYKKTFKIEAAQKFKVGAATSNAGLCINLGAGMTMSGSGTINFVSTSGTVEKIKSNGLEWGSSVHLFFEGEGGKWEFLDTFNTGNEISVEKGELKTGGQNVAAKTFFATGTSKIVLGASTIKLSRANAGLWNIATTVTLEAGTSTIEIEGSGESSKEFVGGKKTYNRVVIVGDNVLIREANTFAELAINTRGKSVKGTSFEKTVAQTITVSFTTNALPGEKILLKSQTVTKQWKLKVASGTVEVSNVELEDSVAEGGAVWWDHGIGLNKGNNSGWRFLDEEVTAQQYTQRPPNLFTPSGLNLALIDPFPAFFPIVSGRTPVLYEHTFEVSQGQTVTKSVTVAKKFPTLVQISGPGEGVFIIGGTSSLEPFTDTVAESGIASANGKAGEETRVKATGGLVRLTNGLICFHNLHEWNPPVGGGSTRWDIIWLGEAKKTALGGLAKAFLIGDAELELSEALAAELAEGAILRIDEETFTVKKTAAGATKVVIKTRAIRETVEANHLIGKAVSLLGSEPDVKAEPPGIVGYELNIGYSNVSLADAKQKVAELTAPVTGRAWTPVAIVEVPAGATKSSQFTFYDVRSFNFLPSPLASVSATRSISQGQTVTHSESIARTYSLTQGQAVTRMENVGVNRALSQGQTVSRSENVSVIRALSQGQAVTRSETLTRTYSLEQGQTVTKTASITRTYSLTQGQSVTESVNVGRSYALAQGQTVTKIVNVGKNLSLAQGSSVTLAHSLTYIVALEQGQTVAFVRSPAKTAAIEQGQSVTFSRGVSRSYSLSQGQALTLGRGVGKNLSLSQGQLVILTHSPGKVFTLTQGQSVTRSEAITHYFTPTQGQAVTRSENVTHTFSCSQGQSAICGRGYLTALKLEQGQSATLSKTPSIVRSLSQGQTVTCTRALGVTRSLSQGQIVTRSVNVNATRTLSQGQTVTHSETPTRVFALTQEQTVSLRRQVAHIFTSSQGQTVVVEFVESLKAVMEALVVMVRPRVALAIPVGVMRMVVSQPGALPVISFTRSQPVISVERAQRSTLGKR